MFRQLSQKLVLFDDDLLDGLLTEITVDVSFEDVSPELLSMVLDCLVDFLDFLIEVEVGSVCHFVSFLINSLC